MELAVGFMLAFGETIITCSFHMTYFQYYLLIHIFIYQKETLTPIRNVRAEG